MNVIGMELNNNSKKCVNAHKRMSKTIYYNIPLCEIRGLPRRLTLKQFVFADILNIRKIQQKSF